MFYHRYSYDAENRLTMAETSMDSVVWEKEARYNYYLHGPLARTTLGDQLVQGIDYAYTLQGWLKGVNAINLSNADYDMGNDGKVGTSNQYVARDAIGFNLNYFSTDYNPIKSTTLTAFPDVSVSITGYRPLYNGNINSMAVNINFPSPTTAQVPQLYAYSYDQLNRLTGMDAYRSPGISNSTNTWGATAQTPVGDYKERVAYDANGNILKYLRQGFGTLLPMDSLSYNYTYNSGKLVNNKLNYVTDKISGSTAHSTNYTEDIDDQAAGNYTYDQIGNLIADAKEGITNVLWNVYGKIKQIQRTATTANPVTQITYSYDAGGNRISKQVNKSATDSIEYTWYVRDASGNIMSTYLAKGAPNGTVTSAATTLMLTEQNLFGSSRIGVANRNIYVHNTVTIGNVVNFIRGKKFFERSNHLGNVLVTISDKKIGHDAGNGTIDYYNADVITANDYYSGGMQMPGRKYQSGSGSYRYSINGQEKETELNENITTAEYWEYDSRIVRRWNIDPVNMGGTSGYTAFGNNPILLIDPNGLDTSDSKKGRSNGDVYQHKKGNSFFYEKKVNGKWENMGESAQLSEVTIVSKGKKHYANWLNLPSSTQQEKAQRGVDQDNYRSGNYSSLTSQQIGMYKRWDQADRDYRVMSLGAVGSFAVPFVITGAVETGAVSFL